MISDVEQAATVVDSLLGAWKDAINGQDPTRVASLFAEDALFQGFRETHSIGRPGVYTYYAGQPSGMTARYTLLSSRWLAEGAIVGYVAAEFGFVDGTKLPVHITVIAEYIAGTWYFVHYHVSRIS